MWQLRRHNGSTIDLSTVSSSVPSNRSGRGPEATWEQSNAARLVIVEIVRHCCCGLLHTCGDEGGPGSEWNGEAVRQAA